MKYLLVCGGTAGHINPALSVAEALKNADLGAQFLFVGAGRELENKLIPAAGYEVSNITVSGFSRSMSFEGLKHNIKTLENLNVAARQSRRIIDSFKPDAVIGTGGYVCYPVLKEAAKLGIPTVLHESNALPGMTTKALSAKVDKVLVAFPDLEQYYKKPENVVVTGTPVRGDFSQLTQTQAKRLLGIDSGPLVVSFWGSLGAAKMNDYMAGFIKLNSESLSFDHIHATGGGGEGLERMKNSLTALGLTGQVRRTDIRPYINNMGTVMTAADLVLCRAGASTIAELCALGRPAILVPSPYVADNHQEKNARAVERAGGAMVMAEAECSGRGLYDAVCGLLSDSGRLSAMAAASKKLGVRDSASRIAGIILALIN